jgi:DNA-binding response OmpR family regulator
MTTISFLLVDDEAPLIEIICRRLRQRGFAVECAFSGMEALQQLVEILVDIAADISLTVESRYCDPDH